MLVSGDDGKWSRADRVLIVNLKNNSELEKSDFHWLWAQSEHLELGQELCLAHQWFSYCIASKHLPLKAQPIFFLELSKILKKQRPSVAVTQPTVTVTVPVSGFQPSHPSCSNCPNMSRMTKQVTAKTQTHKTQAMKAQVEWPNQDGVSPGSEKQIFTHNLLPDCDPGPVYYYVQSEAEFNHTNWIVRP